VKKSDKEEYVPIREVWKPSDGINWDAIQRMRFMNADAEIDPEDGYQFRKDNDE